jgi:hypothetical protein
MSTHRRKGYPHYIKFVPYREHSALRPERPTTAVQLHRICSKIHIEHTQPFWGEMFSMLGVVVGRVNTRI